MRQAVSIFNDVIGPVMIGPSSSHTAASVRIGYMLRALCQNQPKKARFGFSRHGSLAFCHEGQGTDMGLAAGLLGLAMDDPQVAQAQQLARAAGLTIEFSVTDTPAGHPNTYEVWAEGGGRSFSAEFISSGGGMIELRRLNDIALNIHGGYYETICLLGSCGEAAATEQARLAARLGDFADIVCASDSAGRYLLNIKSTDPLPAQQLAQIAAEDVLEIAPVLPIQSYRRYQGLFSTAAELLSLAHSEQRQLWQLGALYEARRGHIPETEVFERMRNLLRIMRRAITQAEQAPDFLAARILGPQARLLAGAPHWPNHTLNAVIQRITLLMEAKSALIPIVAAPTAGSCAALPGTIIGAAESNGLTADDMIKGLLAAAMVGVLIGTRSTFAAEVGGCQAECGAGSGMAAAGLTQMLGGSVEQALCATSLALQNVFGLVCDPVAGRVEVPCLGRNIMAGTNALAMANLALAGFDGVIPLDQTIAALHQVGQKIDASLRCTCQGGLSLTPAARELEQKLQSRA